MKVRDCFDYDDIKRKMNRVVLRNFFLQKIVWNGERDIYDGGGGFQSERD